MLSDRVGFCPVGFFSVPSLAHERHPRVCPCSPCRLCECGWPSIAPLCAALLSDQPCCLWVFHADLLSGLCPWTGHLPDTAALLCSADFRTGSLQPSSLFAELCAICVQSLWGQCPCGARACPQGFCSWLPCFPATCVLGRMCVLCSSCEHMIFL